MSLTLNPLTRNLAACYQLTQSVLKIGSALAERVGRGEVGDSAWRLLFTYGEDYEVLPIIT